ncbi:MAG: hypothetical protein GY755_09635 [Chloroflexi bacterium]|nr:hypothetical protein [Chloroflexota bacterium]
MKYSVLFIMIIIALLTACGPSEAEIQAPLPTANPNHFTHGTYLIGTDIQPGLYVGYAGDGPGSCYWARRKDASSSNDAIIASDDGIGQYYIEVKNSDYSLQTECSLTYLPSLPQPTNDFPTDIGVGSYLVGIEIEPGTYQGQAGTDVLNECYWSRFRNATGELGSVIENGWESGEYYVQIKKSDFAFTTACDLVRVED